MKDKKSMIMVIFIGITIFLFLCFNTTVFATTGTVTTGELRLRKDSSLSSDIIGLLDENQEVEILGEDGDWYKVKVKNDVGYVNKQYVKVKNEQPANQSTEKTEEKTEEKSEEKSEESKVEDNKTKNLNNKKATVKQGSKIRILPVINGDVLNEVDKDQEYTIVSNLGVWSYVKSDNLSGWILTQSLSVEEDSATPETTENNETTTENEQQEEQQAEQKPDSLYDEEKTYYVSASSVNVRDSASKSGNIIDGLSLNKEVTVLGENGDWYLVSVDGTKGYVAKTLLSTTKKEVTSRSSTPVQNTDDDEDEAEEDDEEDNYTPPAPAGSEGSDIAAYAQQFVGYPYVYGASGPNAFDCSGFAQYVYRQFGYSINRTADNQAYNGSYVSQEDLEPGDLVFFNTSGRGIGHVGIYIGGRQFVHASTSRTGVIISSLDSSYYTSRYVTARRIV